jgi:hypothetical protein
MLNDREDSRMDFLEERKGAPEETPVEEQLGGSE